jgi:hypothetical protein
VRHRVTFQPLNSADDFYQLNVFASTGWHTYSVSETDAVVGDVNVGPSLISDSFDLTFTLGRGLTAVENILLRS